MTNKTKTSIQQAIDIINGKLALSLKEEEKLCVDLQNAIKDVSPWYIVVLKTLAYLIGLVLAGYGTTAAACTLFNI